MKMELNVTGDGVKLTRCKGRTKSKNKKYNVTTAICTCRLKQKPFLILCLILYNGDKLKFAIAQNKTIRLIHVNDGIFMYEIHWQLSKLLYVLKVNELNIISELISLNSFFDVIHEI